MDSKRDVQIGLMYLFGILAIDLVLNEDGILRKLIREKEGEDDGEDATETDGGTEEAGG